MEHLRPLFEDALSQEQNLYVEAGRLHIRDKHWSPKEVLETLLEEKAYDDVFLDWVQERKEELVDLARNILDDFQQEDRFEKLKEVFARGGVVPFVGAGLSIPSGYLGWSEFLRRCLLETTLDTAEFELLLQNGSYEEAAQRLHDSLGPSFNEAVENAFGRSRELVGPVQMLPHVFDSCVITTNFDDVIKRSYELVKKPFSEILSGDASIDLPKKLAEKKRILLKLHGTSTSPRGRILTASEYQQHYKDGEELQNAIEAICSRTLLFLGCSLSIDRTLQAMRKFVSDKHDHLARHYAFLPAPGTIDERKARREELAKCNIYPIWYPEGTHDESIEALLFLLLDGVK